MVSQQISKFSWLFRYVWWQLFSNFSQTMLAAEKKIADLRAAYLTRTSEAWRGFERELLIELTRSLDEAAFAFTMAPNREELILSDASRQLMKLGAASALRPLLEILQGEAGGVPWGPARAELVDLADQHLINCGHFAVAQRTAAMERYGLAKATFTKDDYLVLEVEADDNDATEREAEVWLGAQERNRLAVAKASMAARKSYVAAKLDTYVSVDHGWFIRYDPTWEMMEYHRNYATIYAAGTLEADALPSASVIGGRKFEDWISACLDALGRVCHHVACCTRLRSTTSHVELRNLLTVFARKDDIAAVWREAGETAEWTDRIIPALTLDAKTAALCERDHEVPVPYYIDFGRDFVLLPMFGGLLNTYSGMLSYLRRDYRSDWDRAVGGREQIFRQDLRKLFSPSRYRVPNSGFRLRRPDGTELTDVDALVVDEHTGDLALVQLKWFDLYGRSLAERNSRRANLLKANEWVEKVAGWIAGRSCGEISMALGVKAAANQSPPTVVVITRHVTRFSGEARYDHRAHWVSWPSLMRVRARHPHLGMAELLGHVHPISKPKRYPREHKAVHRLPQLTVEVRVT